MAQDFLCFFFPAAEHRQRTVYRTTLVMNHLFSRRQISSFPLLAALKRDNSSSGYEGEEDPLVGPEPGPFVADRAKRERHANGVHAENGFGNGSWAWCHVYADRIDKRCLAGIDECSPL